MFVPESAKQADAVLYLNQAGDQIMVGPRVDPDENKDGFAKQWRENREEWLRQRNEDFVSPAFLFAIGSGYVPLTVAVFTDAHGSVEDGSHRAQEECWEIVEEWLQEHRPEEDLEEMTCWPIPADIEPLQR